MSAPQKRRSQRGRAGVRQGVGFGGLHSNDTPLSANTHAPRLPTNWRERLPLPGDYYPAEVDALGEPNLLGWAVGRCPLCRKQQLSVQLIGDRGPWRCSSCAQGGDLIGFHQKIKGTTFAAAIADLIRSNRLLQEAKHLRALYSDGSGC